MDEKLPVETPLPEAAPTTEPRSAIAGDIGGLAVDLAIKHGSESGNASGGEKPVSRPRGRPPIHGLYSKASGSNGKNPAKVAGTGAVAAVPVALPPVGAPARPTVRSVIPPDLLAKVVKETLGYVENISGTMLEGKAKAAGLTLAEIEPQLKRTLLGDSRKQIVSDLTPLALAEHGIDAELSPTVAIGVILGPWLFSSMTAYMALASLAKEKMEMEKRK